MQKTISAKADTSPTFAAFPLSIITICVGYAVVLFSRRILNDADTYWHIATGTWILEHGAIPRTDPFSFTLAGAPWLAHEWLSELLMALAYRTGGWSGLVILFGAAFAMTCGVLAHYLERWLKQPAASFVFVLGIACVGGSLLARPHLLALTVLTWWSVLLIDAKDRGAAPSWLLLPLMTIWANLHASFVFGLALILPIALEASLEAGERRLAVARRWAAFLLAALAASLLTPHGWRGLWFPFQLMHLSSAANISEWAPMTAQPLQPLTGTLIGLLYVAFTRNVRLPVGRLAIVLGLVYLALTHTRHQMVAGVVGAIVLAKPLAETFYGGQQTPVNSRGAWGSAKWSIKAVLIGTACMAVLTFIRATHPVERTDDAVSPIAALDHVPLQLRNKPVFNSYEFGGYLIFDHVKPFIDGRADLYGDRFMSAYLQALTPSRVALEKIVDKYGIDWALLAAGSPAADMLASLPHWRRLYADPVAVVYVREPTASQRKP